MKILIVGAGGREHAIAWKLLQNSKVEKIFIAPGNAGTAMLAMAERVDIPNDVEKYAEFAEKSRIDLTIVGSEELLVKGIADKFRERGLKIFGPDKKAATLEGSKAYSKDFMKKYGIRTAIYEIFHNVHDAKEFLKGYEKFPVVIKASGLAAGKGVIIAKDIDEAFKALEDIMIKKKFGSAGSQIVIEEFLEGTEASILSFTDSRTIVPLLSAKDHKKIGEAETGLNTGGMGVISPNPYVTDKVFEDFKENIMKPTLKGIQSENMDFAGVIFFGIMITEKGVYLLEYNMRLGDPETQAVLPLMETDLLEIIDKSLEKKLSEINLKWKPLYSCCIVGVAGGYPEKYRKGDIIRGIEEFQENEEVSRQNEAILFIAGAKKDGTTFVTDGGRVLNVVGLGKSLSEARERAYQLIRKVDFDGMYYREDIGK